MGPVLPVVDVCVEDVEEVSCSLGRRRFRAHRVDGL